jgi:hypothetical protein
MCCCDVRTETTNGTETNVNCLRVEAVGYVITVVSYFMAANVGSALNLIPVQTV